MLNFSFTILTLLINCIKSLFARFNYNYGEKYMLNVTVRKDRSSMLSESDNPDSKSTYQSGLFPSFSAGWVISRESFWTVPVINFLKARYSYGKNGSLGSLTPFQYVPLVGFTGSPYIDANGYYNNIIRHGNLIFV